MTTSLDTFTQLHQDLHTTSEANPDDLTRPRQRIFELIQLSLDNSAFMQGHFNVQDPTETQRKQHARFTENLFTCLAWSVACAETVNDKTSWLTLQQHLLQALIDHVRKQLAGVGYHPTSDATALTSSDEVQHPTSDAAAHTSSDKIQRPTSDAAAHTSSDEIQRPTSECPTTRLLDAAATAHTTLLNARAKLHHFAQHGKILQTQAVQQTFILDLKTLIESCLNAITEVLGPAPAPYALFSLGSFARDEACPFSDFEFTLCLTHDDALSHTYGFALLLLLEAQLILLAESGEFWLKHPLIIQSTHNIRYLNVPPALKLPRTNGFNLDYEGGNFPRAKSELIGSPNTLAGHLARLDFQADHSIEGADFIILNALQEAHFFCGEKTLFDDFWTQANHALSQLNPATQLPRHHHMGWCYLRNCADEFIEKFNPNQGQLNIKRHFLRLPVFVTNGLSLLFNIRAHSSQERLAALQQQGQLHPSFANALALLLQIGFYWRIKVHLHYGKECDTVALDQASGRTLSENNLNVPNAHDFTLSTQEFNLFEPLYHEIMMVLEQCTRTFIAQANTSNSLQFSHSKLTHTPDAERAQAQHSKNTHRDNSTHVFQHTQITDLSTVYQNLGAEHFHQGRWPLALAYYQQALQLTQDEALAQQLRDWITNTKTLLEDHQSTMHAVLSALKKAQLPLENAQRGPTFTAPPDGLWPESTVCQDQPYPDGLHGLHPHTLAWLRLGVSHLLTLEDNSTAWQAFHTLRFALPSYPAVYALTDELTLWQQQATTQQSSIPQTHTARLKQSSLPQTYTTRLQRLMAWQDAWPQPKGIRATLKNAWQDSWNALEAMTEAFDPTQHKDALKKGRILLQWIQPNPLNPAEIGNLKTSRLLKPELAQQLIDKHGHLLKKTLAAGQRLTYPLTLEGDTTPTFYAKVYPEFPGMQIAVDTLCALLSGASGNAILAHLYLPQKKGPFKKSRHFKPYPLLLSKSLGDTLQQHFASNTDSHPLDTYSFTWKLIETLLIHPEDDKPDNIALQSFTTPLGQPAYRLVSFDADHAFAEAVLEKKHPMRLSQELLVQLKSIVLCLNTMNHPLNPDAITEFLSLDAASVLEQWLNHCHQFNHQLFKPEGLFSPDIMKTFYEHTSSPAFLPIAFVEGMIADLYQRWHRLRVALSSQRFDSHHDLLAFVNPFLARFYHDAFTQHDTPDKRFQTLPTDYKTIHDKTHNTLLYVTDTGVHQGTLRSLTVAHQKKDIKKDLKTLIEQALKGHDTLFQPKHALNELQTTLAHYQQLDQIQQDLRAGDFQRFTELKIHALKQKLFNGLIWTHYTDDQQRTLLKATQGTQFTKLKLIDCSALTMDKLAKLLKKSHDLVRLEIVNNPHVDNTLGDILAKHNPALQRLYLRRLPKLTQLLNADVNATPAPYTQLTTLVAEHCHIGATGTAQILNHLPYLTQLIHLDLGHNHLPDKAIESLFLLTYINTHLKARAFQLTLAGNEGAIKDDFLRELIAALGGAKTELRCKEQLTLWDEKQLRWVLDNKKFQLLIHSLWLMPQLQSLDLMGNHLDDVDLKALAPYLKDCPNLKSLNLSDNILGDAGIIALAPYLKDCPNLQSLNLRDNNLGETGINALALHLKDCPNLKSLNLSDNILGDAGIIALAPYLKDCPNLQSLNLSRNHLKKAGLQVLASHLKHCPKLQSLNFSYNFLGYADLQALTPHLKDCTNLQFLHFGGNDLGVVGIIALVPYLKDCPQLQSLDLDGSSLGEFGMIVLAPHLKDCPNLQSLNLEWNNLGEAGIKAFALYLKDYPNLQSLNLAYNRLGDAGLQALAPYLKDCPNLQSLNLEYNDLGDAGFKALIPHLQNSSLQQLEYDTYKVSNRTQREIKAILTDNCQRAEANKVAIQQAPVTQPKPSTSLSIARPTVARFAAPSACPPKADKQPSSTTRDSYQDNSISVTQLSTTPPSQLTVPQAIPSHRHSWTNEHPSSFSVSDTTSSKTKGPTP